MTPPEFENVFREGERDVLFSEAIEKDLGISLLIDSREHFPFCIRFCWAVASCRRIGDRLYAPHKPLFCWLTSGKILWAAHLERIWKVSISDAGRVLVAWWW